jgi:hypothetical protein
MVAMWMKKSRQGTGGVVRWVDVEHHGSHTVDGGCVFPLQVGRGVARRIGSSQRFAGLFLPPLSVQADHE